MGIDKVIHYCWFGRNEKSEIINKCIASWKKFCPDYEIIEWNEDNYDINKNSFLKDAYSTKMWAFVSDYARLDILAQYGGIYIDTDVEILKENPFENYLCYDGVMAFANEQVINTGLVYMCTKNDPVCEAMRDAYDEIKFNKSKLITCPTMNAPIIKRFFPELEWNNVTQHCKNYLFISAEEYNPLMKHYGTRTWCAYLPKKYKIKPENKLTKFLRKPEIFKFMENNRVLKKAVPLYTFMVYDLLSMGPIFYIRLNLNKIKIKMKS